MSVQQVRILILATMIGMGCTTLREAPKFEFSNGYYKLKLPGTNPTRVFVENEDDSIVIYLLRKTDNGYTINTTSRRKITLKQIRGDSLFRKSSFSHSSFDFDFLTIPVKFRPELENFPGQLNSNLNGSVFLGFRRDLYIVDYNKLVSGKYKRDITHYGYSFGGLTGLSITAMNPWVTNYAISIEYDGMIWQKGISFIMGIENYTIGIGLGWDHLLDKNRKSWIYQGRPWIGLTLGLNLN